MRVEHMVRVMVISLDLFKDADIKGGAANQRLDVSPSRSVT